MEPAGSRAAVKSRMGRRTMEFSRRFVEETGMSGPAYHRLSVKVMMRVQPVVKMMIVIEMMEVIITVKTKSKYTGIAVAKAKPRRIGVRGTIIRPAISHIAVTGRIGGAAADRNQGPKRSENHRCPKVAQKAGNDDNSHTQSRRAFGVGSRLFAAISRRFFPQEWYKIMTTRASFVFHMAETLLPTLIV